MKLADIKPGTRLELELFNSQGERMEQLFVSVFEWASSSDECVIAAPIHEGVIFPVRISMSMNVYFMHENNLYTFSSMVNNRFVKDNIAYLTITVNSELHTIQRRQYYRLQCCLPMAYRMVSDRNTDEENEALTMCYTKDISGNGIRFFAGEMLKVGKLLKIAIELDNSRSVGFNGRVVRAERVEDNGHIRYDIGVHIKFIKVKDRQVIISFIYEQQRILRKKGLI